jgi:hypothetical protein
VITDALHIWFVIVLISAAQYLREKERKLEAEAKAEASPLMDQQKLTS